MDKTNRDNPGRRPPFERGELGALLRLFSSLGITVTAGITGFFLLGLYLDNKLPGMGIETRGLAKIAFVLAGVALSIYWAYLRIVKHLETFETGEEKDAHGDGKR